MNTDTILPVAKRHLLLANAIVWGAPGVKILVTGIRSYIAVWPSEHIVWLALGTVCVLAGFLWMFPRIVKRYSDRILAFPQGKKSLLALLPAKGWVLVIFMICLGISLKFIPGIPTEFFASFYPGLGTALVVAGAIFFAKWLEAPASTFRPMRRFKQQLPEDASIDILQKAYRGFLSVHGDGGYPYTVPINFLYKDGKLYFHCAMEGHKLDAVRARDKACFTVIDTPQKEPGDWWYHVRSVICFGRVHILQDAAEKDRFLRQLGAKYFPEGYDMEADMQRNAARALVLVFSIEHMSGKRVREK